MRMRHFALVALLVPSLVAAQEEEPQARSPSGGDIVAYDQIHKPIVGRGGMVVSQNRIAAAVGPNRLAHVIGREGDHAGRSGLGVIRPRLSGAALRRRQR